jgi:chemotaxis methyl-accepting protein methylase
MTQTQEIGTAETSGLYSPLSFQSFLLGNPGLADLPAHEQLRIFGKSGINTNTDFFRDGLVLEILDSQVLPSYTPEKVIQVASVGCSTGMEVYSILLKNWARKSRMRVDGYDVNPRNIETALAGEYMLRVDSLIDLFRFEQLELPCPEDAYVVTDGKDSCHKHLSFTPELRRKISFTNHDILKAELPRNYDVVLLLHVLRHFPEKGREKILTNLYGSMNDNAWLICESAIWKDHDEERERYCSWMANIRRLGFEKQRIILPGYFMEDQTPYTQVYRKKG